MTRWTKHYAGFYTLDGTDYGVASAHATDADADFASHDLSRVEWAVIRKRPGTEWESHNDGDNLDWFDTMREARAAAERMARDG